MARFDDQHLAEEETANMSTPSDLSRASTAVWRGSEAAAGSQWSQLTAVGEQEEEENQDAEHEARIEEGARRQNVGDCSAVGSREISLARASMHRGRPAGVASEERAAGVGGETNGNQMDGPERGREQSRQLW